MPLNNFLRRVSWVYTPCSTWTAWAGSLRCAYAVSLSSTWVANLLNSKGAVTPNAMQSFTSCYSCDTQIFALKAKQGKEAHNRLLDAITVA